MIIDINRKVQPQVLSIDTINLEQPLEVKLDNGIPVYKINAGTQDVVKIELIFGAGSWYEPKSFVAYSTSKMLVEGSKKYSAEEIAERIDFYGAFIEASSDKDNASVSLYTLNKYIDKTFEILEEIIKRPSFNENELSVFLQKQKQGFIVNSKKVNYLARTKFNEIIFGEQHPYGEVLEIKTFDNIKREDLVEFYNSYYSVPNCKIIVSGKLDESIIEKLNNHFGGNDWNSKNIPDSPIYTIDSNSKSKHKITKQDTVQSAIRIGRTLFNRTHPEFKDLQVLNSVLGGYFGSRLMNNIREDKGYTYGIGSAIVSLKNSGYFFITSEVGADVCDSAISEIYKELEILKNKLIPNYELELVRNYMMGVFIRSIDGPFALADKFKSLIDYELDYSYYYQFLDVIRNITSEKLRELANKYYRKEDMFEIIVGK
ncbi:MAG: insulinase family protein [Saprospiraceae bacterium]|nr:insulinase family protein [Saprospiraceae bacterium]